MRKIKVIIKRPPDGSWKFLNPIEKSETACKKSD